MTDVPRECFQCGRPTEWVIREEYDDGWFHCECGERLAKVSDLLAQSAQDEEERVKRNLGFYDFRPKRG